MKRMNRFVIFCAQGLRMGLFKELSRQFQVNQIGMQKNKKVYEKPFVLDFVNLFIERKNEG